MFANRVHETSTTTGTGDLTLAGAVSNFKTFTSQFETNQPINYLIDNESGLWETGKGHLSGSTTLVRDIVTDNSSDTTSKISFTSTLQVLVAPSTVYGIGNMPKTPTSGISGAYTGIVYPPIFGVYSTSYIERADRMQIYPFINRSGYPYSNWAVDVQTASAGAVCRMAIYLVDEATGLPTGSPYMESDDIDCGSTGVVEEPFSSNTAGPTTSSQILPSHFFLAIAAEDAILQLASISWISTNKLGTWLGVGANGNALIIYQGFTLGTPTPATAALPSIGTLVAGGENQMIGGFTQ